MVASNTPTQIKFKSMCGEITLKRNKNVYIANDYFEKARKMAYDTKNPTLLAKLANRQSVILTKYGDNCSNLDEAQASYTFAYDCITDTVYKLSKDFKIDNAVFPLCDEIEKKLEDTIYESKNKNKQM